MLNQQQWDQIPLADVRNIGATIAERLNSVGINTLGELRRIGPAEAYQRVRLNNPTTTLPVCYYLYSLYAALEDKDWRQLTASEKQKLHVEAGIK